MRAFFDSLDFLSMKCPQRNGDSDIGHHRLPDINGKAMQRSQRQLHQGR
jgi:hypothetical protein